MSQQRKIPVEEMIRIVELYLSGKMGYTSAYQEAGVSEETFRKWLFRYKTDGPSGFLPKEHNKRYTKRPSSQLFWIIWQEKGRNGRSVRDTGSGIKGCLSIG